MLYLISGDPSAIRLVNKSLESNKKIAVDDKLEIGGDIFLQYGGTSFQLLEELKIVVNDQISPAWSDDRIMIVAVGDVVNGLQDRAVWQWIDNAK